MTEVQGTLKQGVVLDVDLSKIFDLSSIEARLKAVEDRTDDDLDEEARELITNAQGQIVVMQAEILTLRSALAAEQAKVDDDDDDEARAAVAAAEAKIATLQNQVLRLEQSSGGSSTTVNSNDISLATILPLGGNDNARMDAALAAQKADPRRVIRFDYRDEGRTFTKTNLYDHAVQLAGPCTGFQNPEQTGAAGRSNVKLKVNVGVGANSWFVGTKQTFNVTITGLVFQSDNGVSQFWHHPYTASTLYGGYFADLTFYGFKHVFGMPGDAMSITLCHFAGQIQFPSMKDTAVSLRGSDSWWTAKTNIDGNLGSGKYLFRLENLTKSHVSGLYATARGASRALYNESPDASGQGGTFVGGCIFEGHNAGDPAFGHLIFNKSGHLFVERCAINFGMSSPGSVGSESTEVDTALVVVAGGFVSLDKISTNKASATSAASPLAHVYGGTLVVGVVFPGTAGATPAIRRSGSGKLNPALFTVIEG